MQNMQNSNDESKIDMASLLGGMAGKDGKGAMKGFQEMMKPENIAMTCRHFIMVNIPMIQNVIDQVNLPVDGGQLLQCAIYHKNLDCVNLLITKGVDLSAPPAKVPQTTHDPQENYRQAPFIIQAACAGSVEIIEALVRAGQSLHDVGHICLSKRRLNSVASNVIGAAAYHGHPKMLDHLLSKVDRDLVDVQAIETADRQAAKSGPFKPEFQGLTPLQLALVSPNQKFKIVQKLFAKEANHSVREPSTNNNIIHLAARNPVDHDCLMYVLKNAKLNIFERNTAGDTAMTICKQTGSADAVKIIEEFQELTDDTGKKTDELMAELMGEEDKNKRAAQRKKEKKHRSKLQKLADKHGCTIDQLEHHFKKMEEEKAQEEKDHQLAIIEQEKEAELAVKRERQAKIDEIERQRAEEMAAYEEIERQERQQIAAEKARKNAIRTDQHQKAMAAQELVLQQEEPTTMKRKDQKRKEYQEKKRLEEEQAKAEREAAAGERSGDETNDQVTPEVEAEVPAAATKGFGPVGLTGDLAIQKAGKNAKKRLLEEAKREEMERAALKERIKQANIEREAQRVQKEKDARKDKLRMQEDEKKAREAEQQEKEEAEKAAKIAAKKEKDALKRKEKREQKRAAQVNENAEAETPENGDDQPVAEQAPAKNTRAKSSKRQSAAAEPTPEQSAATQAEPTAEGTDSKKQPKEKKQRASKPDKKDKDATIGAGASAAPQKVYQKKKASDAIVEAESPVQAAAAQSQAAVDSEPAKPVETKEKSAKNSKKEEKKSKQESTADSTDLERDLTKMMQLCKDTKVALLKSEDARKQSSAQAAEAEHKLGQVTNRNKELEDQLLEYEQDNGFKTTAEQRQINKELKRAREQLQQQMTVNRTLSSKLMVQEKSLVDEKRARMDLERRLGAALASRPPTGPGSSSPDSANVDDLHRMRNSLDHVSHRVQKTLGQQRQ